MDATTVLTVPRRDGSTWTLKEIGSKEARRASNARSAEEAAIHAPQDRRVESLLAELVRLRVGEAGTASERLARDLRVLLGGAFYRGAESRNRTRWRDVVEDSLGVYVDWLVSVSKR
jgi:hypothetical protein